MKHTAMLLAVTALVLSAAFAGRAQNAQAGKPSQTILRAGSQPSSKGPAETFTGSVTVTPLFTADASASYSGAYVTFEAGARSAWHTHPAGQRLVVTAGVGRTAEWGGRVQEIKAGDVVWCPPGVKHWHGAPPTTAMTHIALTNSVNNKVVEWMEKVTDAQYNAGARPMNTTHALSAKQRSIIPIAAFTATGDQERLRTALTEGLEAGLTVNEIKEILIQMYAYAGFPRSLSGIQTFMAVIDTFLKEHLFADIFARDTLDHRSRELATNAALASMTGTRSQLQLHLGAAMNVGLTEAEMRDFISVLAAEVGYRESESAGEVLTAVMK